MNWDAISAIGDIVGAVAVVVTLLYLALQIRQGTKATQGVGIQTAAALDQEFLLAIGNDPATAKMWATYLSTPDALPVEEKIQGSFLLGSLVRRLENVYLQKCLGTISDEGWRSRQGLFVGIARSPAFLVFLESPPAKLFSKDFLEYMNRVRADEQRLE